MRPDASFQPIAKLGENLPIARKRRGLRIVDFEVQRLPQRVRRPLLPVERISAEQFWVEKRARQANSHARVASGEIPQSALFAFSEAQLRSAQFKWPKAGFSALEDDDDGEERPASALQR